MLRKDIYTHTDTFKTPQKKLRFRGDLNLHYEERLENIFDDHEKRRDSLRVNGEAPLETPSKKGNSL